MVLVAAPEYYHANRAFGFWSLPDRSTPARRALEDQLDSAFDFCRQEVDQRGWYGFWDYGDMMRQYDEVRHQWKYDICGWAWNNTELLPDYWLCRRDGLPDPVHPGEPARRALPLAGGAWATLGQPRWQPPRRPDSNAGVGWSIPALR